MSKRCDAVASTVRMVAVALVTAAVLSQGDADPGSARASAVGVASGVAGTCVGGWSEQQLAMPWTALTAVTEAAGGLWAAGFTKRAHDLRRPTVVRRTAKGWTRVPLPAVARETGLFDLVRADDGRLWAVGYESSERVYRPYVLRGGPGGMDRIAVPSLRGAGASLTAVADGADGVVGVGFSVGAQGEVPMVAQRTPRGWSAVRVRSGGSGALLAVERVGGSTWAAGWQVTGLGVRPLVVVGGGSGWRRVSGPSGDGAILDLAAGRVGRGLWGVGYTLVAGRQRAAAWRREDGRWRGLPALPIDHPLAFLTGVDTTADGIVVVGTAWDASRGRWVGVAARWDGDAWRMAPPTGIQEEVVFHDLALGGDAPWPTVAGQLRKRSLLQTWCATGPGPAGTRAGRGGPAADGGLGRARRQARRPSSTRIAGSVVVRDVTRRVGLAESTQTHGGLVADLDRNGWPDVFISRHGGPAKLMLNVGGRFERPTGAPFPKADRHSCTAADADADGRMDVYCALGADRGAGFKTNELWMRRSDGRYADDAVLAGVADPFGRGRVATFFDLDHDRWPDLFVGNKVPRTDGLPGPSVVYARPGGGPYRSRSTAGFDPSMGAGCLYPADLDGDGWEDLVLCRRNLNRAGSFGIAWLRNERGTLRDRTTWLRLARRTTMDVLPVDLDRDGRTDLVEVTPGRLIVHLRRGNGYRTGAEAALASGRAVAAGDVDRDGDPDLYVLQGGSHGNPPDRVFLTGRGGRSLHAIRVPGTASGGADAVLTIDHDRNGLSDFLVLNGAHGPGPIQLIAFFRD